MVDIGVEFAGLRLKNALIVGAGPNTKNLTTSVNCMKGGFGAIVVRSLHMQHLHQQLEPVRDFWRVYGAGKDLTKDLFSFQSTAALAQRVREKVSPGWGGAARIPMLEEWAEEVRKITRAAKTYDCAVIASIGWCGSNMATEELWRAEAKAMTDAGVDAIQLHTAPSPATEPGRYMSMDPQKYLGMPIRAAKAATHLPVFAKIPVDCCDTVGMASAAQHAGADGVVPVTRWLSMTVDLDHERAPVWRGPGIGGPWSVPIMTGLIFRIRNANKPVSYIFQGSSEQFPDAQPVGVPIIPSGGVRTGADVLGYLIAGANAAEICAQVILEGPGCAERIAGEMRERMSKKGYRSIREFQGTLKLLEYAEAKNIPQWSPSVDESICNGCGACVRACSNEAIRLHDGCGRVDMDYCEGCRTCYYVCPTGAITLTP